MFRRIIVATAVVLALTMGAAAADSLQGIRIEPEADLSYNRSQDYGGWMRMNTPYNRCFNVRDQVLQDESEPSAFEFKQPLGSGWHCTVTSGRWKDRYTGTWQTDPKELDIDHVVPLKEAHRSGAHQWPKSKRREYANYLRDPDHLLAVSATENRSKGDKDPAKYMPPNQEYHCTYLRMWVAIKRRWDLTMDEIEAAFIRARLVSC